MNSCDYAEIAVTTSFSFLRGASNPQDYVRQAAELGLHAIGIADRNTLSGVVRAYKELENPDLAHKPRLLIGARLVFIDGSPDILVYPSDRAAYGLLCQLLTRGKRDSEARESGEADCRLTLEDLIEFASGQLLVVMPAYRYDANTLAACLARLGASAAHGVWLGASLLYRGDDRRRLARLEELGRGCGVALLATNDVLYHHPARRPLQDVLSAIREKTTIWAMGRRLEANAERCLKSPRDMARLFRDFPDAIAETRRFADALRFSLDQLKYQYPEETVPPGRSAQQYLEELSWAGVEKYVAGRVGTSAEATLRATITKELALIEELKYAHYFLTVHDLVQYARSRGILCQGRGSAANSAVCYVLGITSVDPTKIDLLFERFISRERLEPPDIDVDFEHSRREEVMQYIYRRYGRHRAAIVAAVIHYRPRSAIRDVGKALGLTEDVTAALADTVWGSWRKTLNDVQLRQAGFAPDNPTIRMAVELATELIGFPRHLSQHVGGFVLTQDRLDSYVPIGNAAMADRTLIEWDKDDIDTLKMMKVDVLALGMLTCIRRSFDLIDATRGQRWTLAAIPQDDSDVYDMLCRGESVGVFQVESRAQMNMLPRLKPREFYDLVIEVAIVRPGPIQGDMVHPYLRRRSGQEVVTYPSPGPQHGPPDELHKVLHKTLGVPLFQEQAMRIAIQAARFTPEEANGLRRSMATFRDVGTIGRYADKFVGNMVVRGYARDFASKCFEQIKGFGSYGFPESHAASFAQLVYVSAWLKHHHPDAFCCALLNSQPMGFYAPAQIVASARQSGVEIRPVDVSYSSGQNTLEDSGGRYCAVRLGFRQISGFSWIDRDDGGSQPASPSAVPLQVSLSRDAARGESNPETDWEERIKAARERRPFTSLEDFARVTGLPKRALILLADADAFRSLGPDRRQALWQVRRLPDDVPLPLFAAASAQEQRDERAKPLPVMTEPEQVVADYQTTRLSLKGHPMEFLREMFTTEEVVACKDIAHQNDRRHVRCAGVVLVRQRPGTSSGVVFMTIEDETGIANVIIWPRVMEQFRKEVMGGRLLVIEGTIQSSPDRVTHLVANRIIDRSGDLIALSVDVASGEAQVDGEGAAIGTPAPRNGHPRDVRILPPSRDFH